MQTTIGIIKPEAIQRGLVEIIIERIRQSGLVVEASSRRRLTHEEVDLVYRNVKEQWLHDSRMAYLTSNDVILLKVTGENAVKRLLEIRGYSSQRPAAPGTIRGDFAKDQYYAELKKQKKIALTVFHACDSEEEAGVLISRLSI